MSMTLTAKQVAEQFGTKDTLRKYRVEFIPVLVEKCKLVMSRGGFMSFPALPPTLKNGHRMLARFAEFAPLIDPIKGAERRDISMTPKERNATPKANAKSPHRSSDNKPSRKGKRRSRLRMSRKAK